MKIVYMTYGIHYSGGMERVLSVKANYFAEVLEYEVYIVITDGKGRSPFFKFSDKIQIIDLGINYRDLVGMNPLKKCIPYFLKKLRHQRKLSRLLNEIKPDISISMFQYEASVLHKIKDGSKKIIESHFCRAVDLLRNKEKHGISKYIAKYLFKKNSKIASRYDCLVTLTEDDLRLYDDVKSVRCIPNPLTITPPTYVLRNSPASTESAHDCVEADFPRDRKNTNILLAIGRISYQKGFDNLVKIWADIEKEFPNWELHIYGSHEDRPYYEYIQSMIQESKLNRIFIFNPTDNIEKVYEKSDLLAVTSNYEGFNLSIIEGMSYGLPVVSFDCPCGPGEILRGHDCGVLIAPGDNRAFANALRGFMSNSELRKRYSDKAYVRAKDFSIDNIMGKWITLFREL
ncbi:glycosyltransferase family 4 protein [Duncaniella freteri]|uniref:Glycosyltransferase family 4 protein n=2 Tax=Bacteroidales TaxID=171549 RepID=A0A4Z0V7F8_9BACT|nr:MULTISPECIES: glycosyltransferase family 4 protein [Bacteroidales]TGG39292.1 glycosyltransferase family 4 protein [Duncaniella freteri]